MNAPACIRKSTRGSTNAVEIVRRLFVDGQPEMVAWVEEELANLDAADQIHLLRARNGLTQQQLAEKVGTTASAISRLERADCEGHSLSMLRRIGAALGRQVQIAFVPMTEDVEVKAVPSSAPALIPRSARRLS